MCRYLKHYEFIFTNSGGKVFWLTNRQSNIQSLLVNNLAWYVHIVHIWYMISLLTFANKTTTNLTYSPISPEGGVAYFSILALRTHTHTFNITCVYMRYIYRLTCFFWHIPKGYMWLEYDTVALFYPQNPEVKWPPISKQKWPMYLVSPFFFKGKSGKVEMVRFVDPSNSWICFFWVSVWLSVWGMSWLPYCGHGLVDHVFSYHRFKQI